MYKKERQGKYKHWTEVPDGFADCLGGSSSFGSSFGAMDPCCLLDSTKFRAFLSYDRVTEVWTHKSLEDSWEPKVLELHESIDTTVSTEINHSGLLKTQIENETALMEEHIRQLVEQYKVYNTAGIFLSASMMFYVIQKTIFNLFA
jgi:hypothetical protein